MDNEKPFSKLFGLKIKDIVDYIEENRHSSVESIQIERIVPNRYQPRQVFDSSKITELAESIEEHGLLQPIVVRPIEEICMKLLLVNDDLEHYNPCINLKQTSLFVI